MPDAVMIFAAGLGTRMAPLTHDRPKALVEVGGQTLLARAIDLARAVQPRRIVVNTHHFADQIAAQTPADVTLSPEPDLLETGGGLRHALGLLGDGPVFTLNPDAIYTGPNPLMTLAEAWDPQRMDALLLLVPTDRATARQGPGDFTRAPDGRLTRPGPLVYTGAQIVDPSGLAAIPEAKFSLNRLWDLQSATGRLYGVVHPGGWSDVGSPQAIPLAEALLRS